MPKILDCTLRDGGYVNNWEFPEKTAKDIIKLLQKSSVDFIEIGFYHHNLEKIIPNNCSNITAMVEYSKVPIEKIPFVDNSKIKILRVIFKKYDIHPAIEYCKAVKDKGYQLFINATFINQYNEAELEKLFQKTNKIKPYALTITDSMGVFTSKDIKKIYNIFNNELDNDIAICFHSHNNLGLSFSNAKILIEENKDKREIIVDSTVYGMGRGAGNLNTELIMEYLNDNKYDLNLISKIKNKYILPIFKKKPWGYSVPYYLSALHKCHPNYAKDLIDRKVAPENMDRIFSLIPNEKKVLYDKELIYKKLF